MLNKNNDDSTSSEDEVLNDALKEATDHQFFKDTYFSTTKSENSEISRRTGTHNNSVHIVDSTSVKSLRKNLEQEDQFENFGVTPSFQNYVAKKLDEIIEKSIRVKHKKTENNSFTNDKDSTKNNTGIKLLSSSVEFLTTDEEKEDLENHCKRRKIQVTIDDKASLLKCKEVAVSPEWILSKEDTKAWQNKRKEPEFKYKKLKNGTLVEKT